jgi:apolipoprotein N-acyltransferase
VLLAASFPKFGHPALAWVSLTPLIVAVVRRSRHARPGWPSFRLGFVTGVVYFCGTLYWLTQVMATFGGLPTVVAGGLAFSLAAYLAVFVGAFSWILAIALRSMGPRAIWLAPALWVAAEWTRAWLGWAFPWVLLGSSQASTLPVVQLASVTGTYGLSALVALVATAVAALAIDRSRSTRVCAAAAGLLLVTVTAWGAWRVGRNELAVAGVPVRVGLLQGNIPQEQKWNPAFRESIMSRYIALARQTIGDGAEIVLWPEASTPFYFDLDAASAAPVRRLVAESRVPFLIGTDQFERATSGEPDRFFNAAVLVGADGQTRAYYRKIRLVPFGEYVPYQKLLFFVGPLVEAVSDFSAGTDPVVFDADGKRFSVAICYEAVYAGMARTFVDRGAELLTTITNDAWFGRSSAAFQHFEQAGLRAVEQGRYLVRAANTGFSGMVDPYGRVVARSPLFEATAMTVDARLLSGRTIYGVSGDVIVWISLGLAGLVLIQSRRRR